MSKPTLETNRAPILRRLIFKPASWGQKPKESSRGPTSRLCTMEDEATGVRAGLFSLCPIFLVSVPFMSLFIHLVNINYFVGDWFKESLLPVLMSVEV